MSWFSKMFLRHNHVLTPCRRNLARARTPWLRLEPLEDRAVPAVASPNVILQSSGGSPAWASSATSTGAFGPDQIRHAYGIDAVTVNGIVGDGTGQTIAIVDAYDDPNIASDLAAFDSYYGTASNGLNARAVSSFFSKVNQSGNSTLPAAQPPNPNGGWALEESLDVEWAHAIAPGANIILVECNSDSFDDLVGTASHPGGVYWARQQPGISVVSMSFDSTGDFTGETTYDSTFTSPSGHGVTFIASTGDHGTPGGYPAFSPNVLAVGGTSLTLNPSNGNYLSESTWNSGVVNGTLEATGGGISSMESRPNYQDTVAGIVGSYRGIPDVAFDGDPNTGVAIYDSYDGPAGAPWVGIGGTSLSAPCWAGIVALVNQGRADWGEGALDGASQLLPELYSLPSADFHDVTTGGNGTYNAGSGYDLVTGLGTPIVNLVVRDLAPAPAIVAQVTLGTTTFELGNNEILYQLNASGSLTILGTQEKQIAATSSDFFVLNYAGGLFHYQGAGGFTSVGTQVTQIAATSSDFFAVNSGDNLFHYQGAGVFTSVGTQEKQIAATRNDFFVLNTGGSLFHYQSGVFTSVGTQVTQIAATNSDFFALNSGGSLFHYQSGVFTSVSTQITQIAATQSQFFALNSGDNLYIYLNGGFTLQAPSILQIATAQSQVYALRNDGVVFRYTGNGFARLPSPVISPTVLTTMVAPFNDSIYVLGTDHTVYLYDAATDSWSSYATNVNSLSLTQDGKLLIS